MLIHKFTTKFLLQLRFKPFMYNKSTLFVVVVVVVVVVVLKNLYCFYFGSVFISDNAIIKYSYEFTQSSHLVLLLNNGKYFCTCPIFPFNVAVEQWNMFLHVQSSHSMKKLLIKLSRRLLEVLTNLI